MQIFTPGASFVVNGAALGLRLCAGDGRRRDAVDQGRVDGGTFEGEFSSVTRNYAGKGVVRYAW